MVRIDVILHEQTYMNVSHVASSGVGAVTFGITLHFACKPAFGRLTCLDTRPVDVWCFILHLTQKI